MKKIFYLFICISFSLILLAQYDSLWTKTYGGTVWDECNSVIETSDSYYVLAGYTNSYGAGISDFYLIKTHMNGDIVWSKTYGYSQTEKCNCVLETSDSCYLLGGFTASIGAGNDDFWLIKTHKDDSTHWRKTYGGSAHDKCYCVIETSDSCYLLAGYTGSYGQGSLDVWLIKTDRNGDTLWTKTYGGSGADLCHSLIETSDSSYMLAGGSTSYTSSGYADLYLIKTDLNGDTLWTKTYGDSACYEECESIIETSSNNYILTGTKTSYGSGGSSDFWILKVDMNGDTLWTAQYGESYDEECSSITETSDNCFVLTGYSRPDTSSNDNIWVVKIDEYGDTLWTNAYGKSSGAKGRSVIEASDSSYIVAGYGGDSIDFYLVKICNVIPEAFSIIQKDKFISLNDIALHWHHSYNKASFFYELSINSALDTVSQSDTSYTEDNLSEGQYIWFVTAINDYGYRTVSDNRDTFWVDRTSPVITYMDLWPDTTYHGPFTVNIHMQDAGAGIDTAGSYLKYNLNGSRWTLVSIARDSADWYSAEIPSFTDTGTVKYQFYIADGSVPCNTSLSPEDTPHSFIINSSSGIDNNTDCTFNVRFTVNGLCFMQLPEKSNIQIQIYDISGRSVINKAMNLPAGQNTINLNINPGVYFIRINTPYGSASEKIIKLQ